MKVYFHFASGNFSNCYLVGNEKTGQAVIVDPSIMNETLLGNIEKNGFSLEAVLVTHSHEGHFSALKTICKIYSPRIYAAEMEIDGIKTKPVMGDGSFQEAGFDISYMSVTGHSPDSLLFKIENIVFTGDSILAGRLGHSPNMLALKNLVKNLGDKLLSQDKSIILMPGHGPPSTIEAELRYNADLLEQGFQSSQN